MVLRDRRRTRSTSRTLNVCMRAPSARRYRRLALRAGFAACSTRFGALRGPSLAADVLRRLGLLQAGAQRFHQVDDLAGALRRISAMEISWPSTFFWIAAWMRARTLIDVGGGIELLRRLLLDQLLARVSVPPASLPASALPLQWTGALRRRSAAAASRARRRPAGAARCTPCRAPPSGRPRTSFVSFSASFSRP